MDWLRNQTALLRPKIIVCLGRIAAMRIIKPDFKITREHGQFFKKGNIYMTATLHPRRPAAQSRTKACRVRRLFKAPR